MQQITAFKTSDGRLFEDKDFALSYERATAFKEYVERCPCAAPYDNVVDSDVLHDWIVNNRDAVGTLLGYYAPTITPEKE